MTEVKREAKLKEKAHSNKKKSWKNIRKDKNWFKRDK